MIKHVFRSMKYRVTNHARVLQKESTPRALTVNDESDVHETLLPNDATIHVTTTIAGNNSNMVNDGGSNSTPKWLNT
nr:hypothetical protein [Tanacetum cinerariifolium]